MSLAMIKELRERTGAGMSDCSAALKASDNNVETAIEWLRKKGIAKAAKKAGRTATEGLVHCYIHGGGKMGVLLEVNCETDFAAGTEGFKTLVHDLAKQIAASAPEWVSIADVPADALAREKAIQLERTIAEGKPAAMAEKIVEGRLKGWYAEVCLLEQPYIKDDKKKVNDLIQEAVAVIGENLKVRRFARFVVGEGLEKKQEDFAAEVAAAAAAAQQQA
jgi:elongation factor Ts